MTSNKQEEAKKCLQCEKVLTGRPDKKFCNDYCRNTYNYNHRRKDEVIVRQINSILRKNRQILSELEPEKKKVNIHRQRLIEMGFRFNYFTNIYKTKSGKIYHFCYDYGYIEVSTDYVVVVVREKYVR